MVLNSVEEAQKRIAEIGGFSAKLEEVLSYLFKEHLAFKEISKKDNEQRKAELENAAKSLDERLEAETNRLKEILRRENEERQREMRDLEAFTKKENAERKAETENINKILNAENEKRMKEAQALKDKMEKEKKEMQAYLEQVSSEQFSKQTHPTFTIFINICGLIKPSKKALQELWYVEKFGKNQRN